MIQQRITDAVLPLLFILVLVASKALSPLLAILAVVSAWSFRAQLNRGFWQLIKPERAVLWATAALLFWGVLSALWSSNPTESLSGALRVGSAMLAGLWLSHAVKYMPPIKPNALRIMAGVLGVILFILLLEGHTPFRPIEAWMMLKGGDYHTYMESHINRGLCALAVLVWPVVLGLYRKGFKVAACLLPIAMLFILSAFESAAALMGLIAGLLLWGALSLLPRLLPRLLPALISLFFLATPFMIHALLHSPLMDTWGPKVAKLSSNRTTIWRSMFEHGMDDPILGRGMSMSYSIPMDQALMDRLQLQGPPIHPHCFSFQALLELGVIGLVLMSVFVFVSFQRLTKITDPVLQRSALVTASVFLVTGFISFNVWQNWWVACGWLTLVCWNRFAGKVHA